MQYSHGFEDAIMAVRARTVECLEGRVIVTMSNYYVSKLNSQGLFRVYDTEIPRIKQYLNEEISFVREKLSGTEKVLEIAAGYGRIMKELSPHCSSITGMDISAQNVELGKEYLKDCNNAAMVEMDAHHLIFNEKFDVVLCLQNGLSAMRADYAVIEKLVNLLAPAGALYISSYSFEFWNWRLKWFEEQISKGLLGEIDYEQTKDGVIACKDGFKAMTHSQEALKEIGDRLGLPYEIQEVDKSSIFLVIQKKTQLHTA